MPYIKRETKNGNTKVLCFGCAVLEVVQSAGKVRNGSPDGCHNYVIKEHNLFLYCCSNCGRLP